MHRCIGCRSSWGLPTHIDTDNVRTIVILVLYGTTIRYFFFVIVPGTICVANIIKSSDEINLLILQDFCRRVASRMYQNMGASWRGN